MTQIYKLACSYIKRPLKAIGESSDAQKIEKNCKAKFNALKKDTFAITTDRIQNIISQIKDNEAKESINKLFLKLKEINKKEHLEKLYNISEKLTFVEDKKIINHINKNLNDIQKSNDSMFIKKCESKLTHIEELIDAVNTSQHKYSRLNSEAYNVYKNIEGVKYIYKSTLSSESTTEALQAFIKKNNRTNPELTKILYENHYLPLVDKNQRSICKIISDRFNTKVFTSYNCFDEDIKYIYKELRQWDKASDGKAIMPRTIDLTSLKKPFINGEAEGVTSSYYRAIDINGHYKISFALRHEIMHLNEKRIGSNFNDLFVWSMKLKKPIAKKPFFHNEFMNGGIEEGHISYGYTNASEFKSVAAEGDFSKYSKRFKRILNFLGTPKWVFNLKPKKPNYSSLRGFDIINILNSLIKE